MGRDRRAREGRGLRAEEARARVKGVGTGSERTGRWQRNPHNTRSHTHTNTHAPNRHTHATTTDRGRRRGCQDPGRERLARDARHAPHDHQALNSPPLPRLEQRRRRKKKKNVEGEAWSCEGRASCFEQSAERGRNNRCVCFAPLVGFLFSLEGRRRPAAGDRLPSPSLSLSLATHPFFPPPPSFCVCPPFHSIFSLSPSPRTNVVILT